jgi:hypothetical protein
LNHSPQAFKYPLNYLSPIFSATILPIQFRFLYVFSAFINKIKKKQDMKQFQSVLLLFLALALTNCNSDDPIVEETPRILINELLPKNSQHGSDQDGEFDDWIELYNPADEDQDISGYYLTDSKKDLTKWKFPVGTTIGSKSYLIVWADGDTTQVGLHTNYKLSADGENVVLLTPDQQVINIVEYPATLQEQSWARKPNATGNFTWSVPTFNKSND